MMTETQDHSDQFEWLVCVLCGTPWSDFGNVCENSECRGFCTWGKEKDGPPSSWDVNNNGAWTPKPPPAEATHGQHVRKGR